MVSALNHVAHQVDSEEIQPKSKTIQQMLKEKLYGMKIGGKIKGSELNFLNKNASLGIKSITRESATKFNIEPTTIGSFKGIGDDSYMVIEPNKYISGKYFDKGMRTIAGYKITQYNLPPMEIGNTKTNSYIINGNNGYFNKTSNTISSWQLGN